MAFRLAGFVPGDGFTIYHEFPASRSDADQRRRSGTTRLRVRALVAPARSIKMIIIANSAVGSATVLKAGGLVSRVSN